MFCFGERRPLVVKSPVSSSAEKYFNTLRYCRNTLLQIKVLHSKCYLHCVPSHFRIMCKTSLDYNVKCQLFFVNLILLHDVKG